MASEKEHAWKEIGWDGFRVEVPSTWNPGRLGKKYFLLENDGYPALEAKWDLAKGSFAPEKFLGKLKRAMPKRQGVRSWEVPRDWSNALGKLETAGFQWQGDLVSGKGIIVYCGDCRRATLLQFYERENENSRNFPQDNRPKILSSFRDHPVRGKTLWSVYDMRLELPPHYFLLEHSFAPGAFELRFDAEHFKISFHRWSPASIILAKDSLESFARKSFSLGQDHMISKYESEDSKTVEFQSLPPLSGYAKSWAKFRGKPLYMWTRMWYLPSVNRILGATAQSSEPLDIGNLNEICDRYEIVQDTRQGP